MTHQKSTLLFYHIILQHPIYLMFYHSIQYINIIYNQTQQQQRQRNEKRNERERREKVKKNEREMNKKLFFFFFLAFLSVPFQNGTVLITCGKNYEIWNIS